MNGFNPNESKHNMKINTKLIFAATVAAALILLPATPIIGLDRHALACPCGQLRRIREGPRGENHAGLRVLGVAAGYAPAGSNEKRPSPPGHLRGVITASRRTKWGAPWGREASSLAGFYTTIQLLMILLILRGR